MGGRCICRVEVEMMFISEACRTFLQDQLKFPKAGVCVL
jgi:hypothetical protein